MTRPLEEVLESIEYELKNSGGWYLPNHQDSIVKTSDGHLSVLHTSALKDWADAIREHLRKEADVKKH